MIRASALYISLILSLLILLICGATLLLGYTYKMQDRKQERRFVLKNNLSSAEAILLDPDYPVDSAQQSSLFGNGRDSVFVEKKAWGAYETGLAKSWIGMDTLSSGFLIGAALTDSLKVLYLADEDRPMSITGKSLIRGTAYIPKSGIKAAYVESSGYADKTLIYGASKDSERHLPKPDQDMMKRITDLMASVPDREEGLPDSLVNSFFNPARRIHAGKKELLLSGFRAKGNVILSSDSVIVVDADSRLDQVILIAPYVKVADHFRGNLQIFASDSIRIGNEVKLSYPSALMVLKNDTAKFQARLSVGKDALIEGQLFAYEQERTLLMPIVSVGERTLIKGEIWVQGYAALSKTASVNGSVSAVRLMARVASAIYENYLIDVKLDKTLLSGDYLSSKLLNGNNGKKGRMLCRVQ